MNKNITLDTIKKFLTDNYHRIVNNYEYLNKNKNHTLYDYICTDVLDSYLNLLATDISIQLIPTKEYYTYSYADIDYIKQIYPMVALKVLEERT